MGRHIGQPGSPEQVILLFARWKPRGFLSDLSSERCDAIPKGGGLFGTAVHDVAPIIRLERDGIRLNRHRALDSGLSMIFSENRFTLFRIML
jgi:hypothetical protein